MCFKMLFACIIILCIQVHLYFNIKWLKKIRVYSYSRKTSILYSLLSWIQVNYDSQWKCFIKFKRISVILIVILKLVYRIQILEVCGVSVLNSCWLERLLYQNTFQWLQLPRLEHTLDFIFIDFSKLYVTCVSTLLQTREYSRY